MRDLRYVVALVVTLVVLTGWRAYEPTRAPAPAQMVRHFTPASERYQYLPFDVPQGTTRLRIAYQYDHANGDTVVDLGLFEPGPLDLGTAAFRGYSGGARSEIIIGAEATTPGYRPGPLPPGQWHLLLGLYKVASQGVDVTVTVATEPTPPAGGALLNSSTSLKPADREIAPLPIAAAEPAARLATPGWLMGALHTHTLHSDGTIDPAALMQRFRDLRFDFVAITDHNNTTHRYELGPQAPDPAGPLWIGGEEVTTPGGHASVWGLDPGEWVDFRVSPGDPRIKDLVATARRHGALFSVNHPVSTCLACGWTHDYVEGIDGIEISNGRHGEVAKAIGVWEGLLQSGRRITAVGSSDWHSDPNPIDVANVRVYAASRTTGSILEAIRGGRVIVMRGSRDRTPDIVVRSGGGSARVGDSLAVEASSLLTVELTAPGMAGSRLVMIQNGTRHAPVEIDRRGHARLERPAAPLARPPSGAGERGLGYVRFEIEAVDGARIAITNPVYLVAK